MQAFFARRRRVAAASAAALPSERVREPIAVEYARSFFPVIILVLVIRSFLFEPFRIPSDSMMPTLFDGDFIFVSKYSYGLRLPVTNTLVFATGTPQRGDVIVFRLPPNPKINYIKRLVGLPGDRIRVDENNQLYVNDKPMPQDAGPPYTGPKQDLWNYAGVPTAFEQLGSQAPSHHVRQRQRQDRRMGGARRGTISSWATTATTARTAAGSTNRMRRGSFRSRIWSVKRCEFGLILILVTDLSGEGSGMRLNRGSFREAFMRKHQQGMTFIGLLCILAMAGVVVYAGIRLAPVYLNYMKVARTMEAAATEVKGDNPDPQAQCAT